MKKGSYRHPKHDEVAALLRSGMTVKDAATRVGMGRAAAMRVRHLEGIKVGRTPTATSLLASNVIQVLDPYRDDIDTGHLMWIGRRDHGTPVMRHKGRVMSAAAVAYELRYGRPPKGIAKSDCHVDGDGPQHCMNPAHIQDEDDRQRERHQLRALMGLEAPAGVCRNGHDQKVHGKVEADLRTHCGTCSTQRRAANRRRSGK